MALLEGHLHVVRVVGEAAHQLAVGVGVEVAQGELLKLVEQVPAQAVAALLSQLSHQVCLGVGAHGGAQIDARQLETAGDQLRHTALPRLQGQDKAVEDGLLQIGCRHAQQGGGHHTDQGRDEHNGPVHDILYRTGQRFSKVLGLSVSRLEARRAPGAV